MALSMIGILTFIIACVSQGGLAEMQVVPSTLRLSGTNQTVTLTCSIPSTATVQSVYAMTMSRNTSSQPSQEQVLALADAISPQARLVSASEGGLPANSATVSGGTTQKSMQVILRQPDCKDAGVYRCVISYNNGTDAKPSAVDSSQNLTVTVPPSNITMSVSPDNEINVANTTVELLCNAIIGINIQGAKWTWEYNDKIDGWRTYTQDSDIRMDTPTLVPGTCYYRQVCYLTLVLALADSEREYKCTVENDGDKDSASLTLGIVNEDGNAPIQTSSTQSHTLTPVSPTENYSSTAGTMFDNTILCLVTSVCLMVLIQTGP
ncbi:uncharacterized protein LOC112567956 isoform X2 [Pomacea canaliculata]|uniref:uncharacterized protein LOC112567956 isoform X2 n=1 Tax=Pomacea canaliculata TaxID=400727 RepID=UPI000D739B86|nr:uncharacterized protein LOC112567956 isoform X2 [Pomacea canaliculata]